MADTSKNCQNFSNYLKFCDLKDFTYIYSILVTVQYFRLWKYTIMDQFVTFRKGITEQLSSVVG